MQIVYVILFEYRSDNGPSLVGPFGTEAAAGRWVTALKLLDSKYSVLPMYVPDTDHHY